MTKPKLSKKKREEIIKKYGKIPTKEEAIENIFSLQQRMRDALKGAWETAPDDPEIRVKLTEDIELIAKLQKELEKVFGKKLKKN